MRVTLQTKFVLGNIVLYIVPDSCHVFILNHCVPLTGCKL